MSDGRGLLDTPTRKIRIYNNRRRLLWTPPRVSRSDGGKTIFCLGLSVEGPFCR